MFIEKIRQSSIAKDSLWSVGGNVFSLFLLLISGIVIARLIGKEAYGQYGAVKNMMTAFASLTAFGFGYSSTKIISSKQTMSKGESSAILKMVLIIGIIFNVTLIYIAKPLANMLNKPDLNTYFIAIGLLMLLRALWTTLSGILAGYKLFRQLSICNIISSAIFALLIVPLTILYGVDGAILNLIIYQTLNAFFCYIVVWKYERGMTKCKADCKNIFKFTFPIAIHEFSHTISSIAVIMIILYYSSYGEYAIYSVSTQWNAIIIIIPTLMMNVTLSYLSELTDKEKHNILLKRMLFINFCCSFVPMLVVFFCSRLIVNLYGETFHELPLVLNICVCSTIISSLVLVFQSNLISEGRNWILAKFKITRDIIYFILLIVFFRFFRMTGALTAVVVDFCVCLIYLTILYVDYKYCRCKVV